MQKIFVGPAGSPEKSTLEGVGAVKRLGLQAMEVQFTHGIKMSTTLARAVGTEQKKEGTVLSVHGPYYINLSSSETQKIEASKKRILHAAELAHYMHASPVVFHPGFLGKLTREEAGKMITSAIADIQKTIKKKKWNVEIAPEVMGRFSQSPHFEEAIAMARKLKTSVCIDVCHIYALNQGKIDFSYVFSEVKKLKRKHVHFHFSGVEYGPKGERRHLPINGNPDFRKFAKALVASKQNATIICESPTRVDDAGKMKKTLEKLGHKF